MKTNRELRSLGQTLEQQEARHQRNLAVGIAIGCIVLLFHAVTNAKVGPGVLNRPL